MFDGNGDTGFEVSDDAEWAELQFQQAIADADGDEVPGDEIQALLRAAANEDNTAFDAHVADIVSDETPPNKREVKGMILDLRADMNGGGLTFHEVRHYPPDDAASSGRFEVDLSIQGERHEVTFTANQMQEQRHFRSRIHSTTGVRIPKRSGEAWEGMVDRLLDQADYVRVDEPPTSPEHAAAEHVLDRIPSVEPVENPGEVASAPGEAAWHDESASTLWVEASVVEQAVVQSHGEPSVDSVCSILDKWGYLVADPVDTLPGGGFKRVIGFSVGALIDENIVAGGYFEPDDGSGEGLL